MRRTLVWAFALFPAAALAHPHSYIDQQMLVSLGPDEAVIRIVIVPSSDDGPAIWSHLDRDQSGDLSDAERDLFAQAVLSGITVSIDGISLPLERGLLSVASVEEISHGVGTITLDGTVSFDLTVEQEHLVEFAISYDAFSPEWFIQPFFRPELVDQTTSQRVERSAAVNAIGIRLNAG